ncbi:AraC family transcriptional regulator [Nocardia brasiliensis]|uniref:AraC family transcriptional regulator n=1 Tax=Nocardia brasiliensis (strain ATCC 700358 / HUJEG-1) TaxID=1133849 RepID=K0EKY7_NOCB7|nr:AraC family transcriptional regulator [Nocardia brasiliensis]AFU00118.1 AraC family transcriptional regulator [Nocardia brasiliensis ATCC 700358]OCF86307.1 hypothetical protein AW168_31545 [Nocardia brasiliensis]
MALVLDTTQIEASDRAEFVSAALQSASAPAHIHLTGPERAVSGRIDAWQFGDLTLSHMTVAGFRAVRTVEQVRCSPADQLLVTVVLGRIGRMAQDGDHYEFRSGELAVSDLNRPYDADWCGGALVNLQVPLDRLDLPSDTVRRGAGEVRHSPLRRLVADHLAHLAAAGGLLQTDPAARRLGEVGIELVHALVTSAATRCADGAALPGAMLLDRVRDFVLDHLADPDLNAARIAHAHRISVRYLYQLCARADFRLEQWIIVQRLERVRGELARPENWALPISVIAQRNGFRNVSHFNRRFRAAYGMTPREWRHAAHYEWRPIIDLERVRERQGSGTPGSRR